MSPRPATVRRMTRNRPDWLALTVLTTALAWWLWRDGHARWWIPATVAGWKAALLIGRARR